MTREKRRIAYQGVPGAFSHQCCRKVFPDYHTVSAPSFQQAMEMVEQDQAVLAMIPLENSTAGRVEEIYRLIPDSQLTIVGEHFEPITHCLLVKRHTDISQLRSVASHPQALAQCKQNIDNLGLATTASFNTAGAAQALSQNPDQTQAVIASPLAAELYDLAVLKENFEDTPGNTTRFIILSKGEPAPDKQEYGQEIELADKQTGEQQVKQPEQRAESLTSLYFTTQNIPAALYKTLGGFATHGINLLKIESYISCNKMTQSSFYLDVAASMEDIRLKNALKELAFYTKEIRILGSYPAHPFRYQ